MIGSIRISVQGRINIFKNRNAREERGRTCALPQEHPVAKLTPLLTPGERLVYEARISPMSYALPVIAFMVALGTAAAMKMLELQIPGLEQKYLDLCLLGLPALTFLWIISTWLDRMTTVYGVTSRRVIVRTGLFSRHVSEMRLGKIESIDVAQGIDGRIFRYGDIRACGTGDSVLRFAMVTNPMKFRHKIEEAMSE